MRLSAPICQLSQNILGKDMIIYQSRLKDDLLFLLQLRRHCSFSSWENTEKLSPREQGESYGRQKDAFHHLRGWFRTVSYFIKILPHDFSQPQIRKEKMESIRITMTFILNFNEGKKRLKSHVSVILKDNKSYTLIHSESTAVER